MTIEVRKSDGSQAYIPVSGPDGDAGLFTRCQLDVENHNQNNPPDPWSLWQEQSVTDAQGNTTTQMVQVFPVP